MRRLLQLALCLPTLSLFTQQALFAQKVEPMADAKELAAAFARFAVELHGKLAAADKNLCCSPASIAFTLLMAHAGARGDTAAEMAAMLAPKDWAPERIQAAALTLLTPLRHPEPGRTLTIVDDLWLQHGHELLTDYTKVVSHAFGAEVHTVDFAAHTADACKTINDYVKQATADRIQQLVSTDSVPPDTKLVLTNAVYFLANWQHPFKPESTRPRTFTCANGNKVDAPTMIQTASFQLAETEDVQVLRMFYVDGKTGMDFVLPRPGKGLDVAVAALLPQNTANWQGQLKEQPVLVMLPRFRCENAFQLKDALTALGMQHAFRANAADFQGIDAGKGALYIGEVLHKTFLEVGEKGTEAAAATAAVMRAGSPRAPKEPAHFFADRPFAYALRDVDSGLILFCGHVADPQAR